VRAAFSHIGDNMDKRITDREVYPAIWILLVSLAGAFFIWKYLLHEPTISRCWIYQTWNIYCPGCGGTRALLMLIKGKLLQSFWYHPVVPVTVGLTGMYMTSQTIWRLRGKSGWVLHFHSICVPSLLGLVIINCLFKNLLWLVFGIVM